MLDSGFVLALDTSGDWKFIAGVVIKYMAIFDIGRHIASINHRLRKKIIIRVLNYIDKNCYGICVKTDLRQKVRKLRLAKNRKKWAWEYGVFLELKRIALHLKSRGLWPITEVYADGEFQHFTRQIAINFNTNLIRIGKYPEVVLADILAYTNFAQRNIVRKFKNIVEL
ncbi:MAG: hypothetical protein Q6363_000700 [Candidatus Njordarchaeota archaeon]